MNKILIGLVVLVAGALVGWYWFGGSAPKPAQEQSAAEAVKDAFTLDNQKEIPVPTYTSSGELQEKGGGKERTVVMYTDTGYAPKTVTVTKGSIVTFVNESSRGMWTASDPHLTHQLLPGFDEKAQVVKGGTYEYTFEKVGTWTYHNHVNPTDKGTVVVTE
jgi:plastocyanin